MPGPGRIFLDFLPQFQDVVVDRPGRGELVVSPDLVKKRLPGDHFAFGGDEVFQDIDFKGRQVEFLPRALHFEMDEIDLDVPGSEALGNGPRLHFLAAQMGLDPGQELAHAERLGDVIVGPDFGAPRPAHLVPFVSEVEFEPLDQVGLVLDDQYLFFCLFVHFASPFLGPETGKMMEKTLPFPGSLSTSTLPPWASAVCLARVRPGPLPGVSETRRLFPRANTISGRSGAISSRTSKPFFSR